MDLQFITDPYACITYVTSYMLKSERTMSELLRKVADQSREDDIKTKLKKVGSAFLNNREVSAQEAAYRLLSIPLKRASRQVIFVNTAPKDKRVAMMKPLSVLQAMPDDDEDIFCTSLLDRYGARPLTLDNMCLAEFAANYATSVKKPASDPDDHLPNNEEDDGTDDITTNKITLLNGLGSMRKRKREIVIRFHKEKSDGEAKYRGLLMLYYPWRNEDRDIMSHYTSYKEHYEHVRNVIDQNEMKYTQNEDEIERAFENLERQGPPEHVWDAIAPGAEYEQAQQEDEGIVEERYLPQADIAQNIDLAPGQQPNFDLQSRYSSELGKVLMTPHQYRVMMQTLNEKQMEVLKLHRKWCKDMILALKNNQPTPVYRIFLSGPGGVGKSHIIKLVHYETMKLLKPLSGYFDPDDIPVILTAFTGTAAFGIEGMTLHSAFNFSAGPRSKREYQPLSSDRLNTLRSRLGKLKLLIIDEVSMVGSDLLYHIHRRLQDITGQNDPDSRFGQISILAVGDLYQLQPVGQSHVFALPSDIYARLHGSLWEENFQMIELTASMRQRDDKSFAELLMRVRTATCTNEDINILKSREITKDSPSYPEDVLHVFKTNKEVDAHNFAHINKLATPLFNIKAIDKKKDVHTGLIDVVISTKASDTGGLREVVSVTVGARIMITVNINVSDGLANGVCGTVVGLDLSGNDVHAILVKFDSDRVGRQAAANSQYTQTYPGAVPIKRQEVTFYTGRGRSSVQATRIQFPVTLAWGCTIHKVQGKTLDNIVVSMQGKGQFMPGQAYVALSRVKTLSGLYLLGFNESSIRINPAVKNEMTRLQNKLTQHVDRPTVLKLCDDWLKISLLNIRSYLEHLPDMKADHALCSSDVLCFVETFLHEGQNLRPCDQLMPAMKCYRAERPHSANLDKGGIMIMALPTLSPTSPIPSVQGIEYRLATVSTLNKKVNIVVIYRPQTTQLSVFKDSLKDILKSLDLSQLTVVLGDFNCDLLNTPEHSIVQFMAQYGFNQVVTKPTTDYGSLLDHVYLNGHEDYIVDVVDTYYSDHDAVYVSIKI